MASGSNPLDPADPLSQVRSNAERAIAEADARVGNIQDAPTDHTTPPPPPIPDLLAKPLARPAKPTSTTSRVSGGMAELGKSLAIGLDFLWMLGAGAGLGWLADRARGHGHVGLLIGMGLGFLAGTWRLLARLNKPESHKPKPRP